MIKSFKNKIAEDIFNGLNSSAARKINPTLHVRARNLLDALNAITKPSDLKIPSSNRLHQLKGDLAGFWSISINDQYRIIFEWIDGNAENVGITDYH